MNIKKLYDEHRYQEISEICRNKENLENFNVLDFMHAVAALKKLREYQLLWDIAQISYAKFPESRRIDNNVGCAIYHLFIKNFDPQKTDFNKFCEHIHFIVERTSGKYFRDKREALKLAITHLDTTTNKEWEEKRGCLKAKIRLCLEQEKNLPQPIQNAYNELFKKKLDLPHIKPFEYINFKPTIYSNRTLEYTLFYFPVHFYKVWYPLFYLLDRNELPTNIKILELGVGPGTTTFSILCFYRKLALEHPGIDFSIDYTGIEKEKEFEQHFNEFKSRFLKSIPKNLIIKNINFVVGDAFEKSLSYGKSSFDMIVESNLLNNQEDSLDEHMVGFNNCLNKLLKKNGIAILIETAYPCKQWSAISYPALLHLTEGSVAIGEIQWVKDLATKGARYPVDARHKFSCMILKKGDN